MPLWLELLLAGLFGSLVAVIVMIVKGIWWAGARVTKVDMEIEDLKKRATKLEEPE